VFGTLWFVLPSENPVDPGGKIDYFGVALGTSGLIVFQRCLEVRIQYTSSAWILANLGSQAPAVGWSNSSEAVLLILSIVLLGTFTLWEWRFPKNAIMPLEIWKAPSFVPLVLVVLFSFMSFGTSLWYIIPWQQEIRYWSVLHFGIGWIPFGIFGVLASPAG